MGEMNLAKDRPSTTGIMDESHIRANPPAIVPQSNLSTLYQSILRAPTVAPSSVIRQIPTLIAAELLRFFRHQHTATVMCSILQNKGPARSNWSRSYHAAGCLRVDEVTLSPNPIRIGLRIRPAADRPGAANQNIFTRRYVAARSLTHLVRTSRTFTE
jgi:hypothetical protein